MIKTIFRALVCIAIWVAGCAIADAFPASLNRCWVMLWGAFLAAIQTVIVRSF